MALICFPSTESYSIIGECEWAHIVIIATNYCRIWIMINWHCANYYDELTSYIQGRVVTLDLANFILGKAVVGAGIASFAFLRGNVQEEEWIVQHHSMRG